MRLVQLALAVGMSVSLSATAVAQTSSTSTPKLPPVELGVGIDATWLRAGLFLDENVVAEPMVHFRATQPMTPNVAIEAIFAVSRWFNTNDFDYRTEALYAIQAKHNIWRRERTGVFATYGATGSWTRVLTYDTWHPPFCLIVGGGFQQEFARRAALRVEMQGVLFAGFAPMGSRLSTGVSFPLGRYR
jgi:hypothetical protein